MLKGGGLVLTSLQADEKKTLNSTCTCTTEKKREGQHTFILSSSLLFLFLRLSFLPPTPFPYFPLSSNTMWRNLFYIFQSFFRASAVWSVVSGFIFSDYTLLILRRVSPWHSSVSSSFFISSYIISWPCLVVYRGGGGHTYSSHTSSARASVFCFFSVIYRLTVDVRQKIQRRLILLLCQQIKLMSWNEACMLFGLEVVFRERKTWFPFFILARDRCY